MKTQAYFDHKCFFRELDAVRQTRRLTWYGVWHETYIPQTQLMAIPEGKLSATNLAILCVWGDLNPGDFICAGRQEATV